MELLCWSNNDPFCVIEYETESEEQEIIPSRQYVSRQCGYCANQFLMIRRKQQEEVEDQNDHGNYDDDLIIGTNGLLGRPGQYDPKQCECGLWYCNESCQMQHYSEKGRGHRWLCVGPVDETHPLYRYKLLALTALQGPMNDEDRMADDEKDDNDDTTESTTDGDEHVIEDDFDYSYLYPTLMLALELVVVQSQQRDSSPLNQENHPTGKEEKNSPANNFLSKIFEQSYQLVQEILKDRAINNRGSSDSTDPSFPDHDFCYVLSLLEWIHLLQAIQKYRIDINVDSPWSQLCKQALETTPKATIQSSAATTHTDALVDTILEQAKKEWNIANMVDDEMEKEKRDEEDNVSSSVSPMIDDVHLMDEPDYYFPPITISALVKQQGRYRNENVQEGETSSFVPHALDNFYKLEHSCLPSHGVAMRTWTDETSDEIDKATNNMSPQIVELQPVPKSQGGTMHQNENEANNVDEPATICRVDKELDLEERAYQLQQIYSIGICSCVRCIVEQKLERQQTEDEAKETINTKAAGVSYESLGQMLELAKFQQRHDDALRICQIMLQHRRHVQDHQKDHLHEYASILLDRARITGWKGKFEEREIFLNDAEREMLSLQQEQKVKGSVLNEITSLQPPPASAPFNLHQELLELNSYYRTDWDGCCDDIPHDASLIMKHIPKLENRAYISENLLDAQECSNMIDSVENHVRNRLGGMWTTSRHYAVPTTDIAVYQVPEMLEWFNHQLQHKIYPVLQHQFMQSSCSSEQNEITADGLFPLGRRRRRFRILDAFFVKYDAKEGQRRLPLHQDQSVYSLTIAMNSSNEYGGGGTYFAETGSSYTTNAGGMVSFHGDLVHAGNAITSGVRYIIACFLYVEEERHNSVMD